MYIDQGGGHGTFHQEQVLEGSILQCGVEVITGHTQELGSIPAASPRPSAW